MTPEERAQRLKALEATLHSRGLLNKETPIKKALKKEPSSLTKALDTIAGFGIASAQAPAFNFADEALGKTLSYPASIFSDKPRKELEQGIAQTADDLSAQFMEDYPAAAFGGQTAASILAMLASRKLVGARASMPDPKLLKQMAFLAPTAGAGAVAAGAGAAEGNLDERLNAGLEYFGPGAMMGAAFPVLGRGLSKGSELVVNALGLNRPNSKASGIAQKITQPLKRAVKKTTEVLGAGDLDPKAIAEQRLLKTLQADAGAEDVDGMISELETYTKSLGKKPVTVAEIFEGDETKQLGETVANLPGNQQGKAKQFFTERQKGKEAFRQGVIGSSGSRILDDLKEVLAKGQDFDKTAKDIITQRRTAAGPKYQAMADVVLRPEGDLVDIMDRLPEQAFDYGSKLAKLDGAKTLSAKLKSIPTLMEEGKELPDFSMQELDYLKQGMDDYVNALYSKEGTRGLAGKAKEVRNVYRDQLDVLYPEYASTRAAYAGKSAMLDALEEGRNIFSKDFDLKSFTQLPDSEKEMVRLGAFQAFKDMVDNKSIRGTNLGQKSLNQAAVVDRFSNLFDDEAQFQTFLKGLKKEEEMTAYGQRVLGNSATARRLAGKEAFEEDNAQAAQQTARLLANPTLSNALSTATSYVKGLSQNLNKYVAEEIGDLSFEKYTPETLARLQARVKSDKALTEAQKTKALGYLSAATTQMTQDARAKDE